MKRLPLTLMSALLLVFACGDDAVVVVNSPRLSVGLVAHYSFNGNSNDATGSFPPATVVGAKLVKDRFGKDSSAYRFNGFSDYLLCGDILDGVFSDSVSTFSVSGWAKSRSYGSFSSGGGFIIGKNAGGSTGPYQWNVTHINGLIYGAAFSDTAAKNYRALTSPMATGGWFHFVLVFDGNLDIPERLSFYVNGYSFNVSVFQEVGVLRTTTSNSLQNLTIGATHEPNAPEVPANFYDGDIDDIRIYHRSLSPSEVVELYHLDS